MKRSMILFVVLMLFSSMFFSLVDISVKSEKGSLEKVTDIWMTIDGKFSPVSFSPVSTGEKGELHIVAIRTKDNKPREIDSCKIILEKDPFYFSITFTDYTVGSEGSYKDLSPGYFYLSKEALDKLLNGDISKIASKELEYKTVELEESKWLLIEAVDFNKEYVWKEFDDSDFDGEWFSWGSNDSIRFEEKAMYIKKVRSEVGTMLFDFEHPVDNSGQVVAFNKKYLLMNGIANPIFEQSTGTDYCILPYTEDGTHFYIDPPHFSYIGVHEASTGTANGSIGVGCEAIFCTRPVFDGYEVMTTGALCAVPGDINGDGDNDIVVGYDLEISWYENDGYGRFTKQEVRSPFQKANFIVVDDINGDGDEDVISFSSVKDNITLFLNDGGGTSFTAKEISTFNDDFYASDTGDIDNDGDVDIVVTTRYASYNVTWWENNGSISNPGFSFHGISIPEQRYFREATLNDTDSDGDLDLIYTNNARTAMVQNLGGTFHTNDFSISDSDSHCILDGDNDGDFDVATCNSNGLYIHEDSGFGLYQSFTGTKIYSDDYSGSIVYCSDLDDDGDEDIVIAADDGNSLDYFINNGTSGFYNFTRYTYQVGASVVDNPLLLRTSDFTADGIIDVIYTDSSYPSDVVLFKNNFSEKFNVSRTAGLITEKNNVSFTITKNHSSLDDIVLRVPVSTLVSSVTAVRNNTQGGDATEVNSLSSLVNDTYYFDSANDVVYIMTTNITGPSLINWSVNCSVGTNFNISFPTYLNVGDLCVVTGKIKDADGNDISGIGVECHLYDDGEDMITPVEWNCTGGNVQLSFYTTGVPPGTYELSMEFDYNGLRYKEGSTLYLSVSPPSGVYARSSLHFSYYDNDTGMGISQDKFKLYVSEDSSIDNSDRVYRDYYGDTYTSQVIYYRVDDFFDNQVYPSSGNYETLSITEIDQWENVPIDWYSYSVKNMNHSIVYFRMTNGSTTYDQYLYPYEPFYFNVLPAEYTINLTYYNSITDAVEGYNEENVTINNDGYYWIRGYDLQDIIIEVIAVNTSLDSLTIDISAGVELKDSTVENLSILMHTNLSLSESNITNLITNVWASLNITNSSIRYLNTTIWGEFTIINTDVNNTQVMITGMWKEQNNSFQNLENRSTVVFSFYNTNEGLGLDRETMKVFVNGTRLIGDTWYTNRTTDKINVTVKDYYNNTLYTHNFTINTPYYFIDVGLTYHSYVFGNLDEEWYMLSFRKNGANFWWERPIVSSGHMEFLIPTGTYRLRIYDSDKVEYYNASEVVSTSKGYVIYGTNLSLILSGLSTVKVYLNNLLENFEPDIVEIGCDLPKVYSIFDVKGCPNTQNITKVCPAQVLMATTYSTIYANDTMNAFIPRNTTDNGTIYTLDDYLYFEGADADWVNITFSSNGTKIQNTSYIPNQYDLGKKGHNVSVSVYASHNITVTRKTRYQQVDDFYWTKYLDENKYQATVEFENPLNDTIWDCYFIIMFADDETPDYKTLTVHDVTNDVDLDKGEHFEATADGIHLLTDYISASGSRSFKCTYYSQVENIQPSDAITMVTVPDRMTEHEGKNYYYMDVQWTNDREDSFIGPLHVKFGFEVKPNMISPSSIDIWDDVNNKFLQEDEFTYTGSSIIISQEAVGTVQPQSTRQYTIYYLGVEDTLNDADNFLMSEFAGPFLWIHVVDVFIVFVAVSSVLLSKRQQLKDRLWIFWLCMLVLFFVNMYVFI